jgi:hypothetical protein
MIRSSFSPDSLYSATILATIVSNFFRVERAPDFVYYHSPNIDRINVEYWECVDDDAMVRQ